MVRGKARSPRRNRGLPGIYPGDVLLFHAVASAVPSALAGLTSVFGMGTGVTPPLWSPGNSSHVAATIPECPQKLNLNPKPSAKPLSLIFPPWTMMTSDTSSVAADDTLAWVVVGGFGQPSGTEAKPEEAAWTLGGEGGHPPPGWTKLGAVPGR